MEFFRSTPKCSNCKAMLSLKHPETVIATIKAGKANQEHYYCGRECFWTAMEKASHFVELEIIEVMETAHNRFDVLCNVIEVEFVG
jgi:hypothetical protein